MYISNTCGDASRAGSAQRHDRHSGGVRPNGVDRDVAPTDVDVVREIAREDKRGHVVAGGDDPPVATIDSRMWRACPVPHHGRCIAA
jgi:hypothetical protein